MRCRDLIAFGWCLYCYEGKKGRRVHPGHYGYRPKRFGGPDVGMRILRNRGGGDGKSGRGVKAPTSKGWLAKMLAVFEFLTADKWDDGEPRTVGTINVFCEQGS